MGRLFYSTPGFFMQSGLFLRAFAFSPHFVPKYAAHACARLGTMMGDAKTKTTFGARRVIPGVSIRDIY